MIQLAFQNHHHSRSRGNPKKKKSPHFVFLPWFTTIQPKQEVRQYGLPSAALLDLSRYAHTVLCANVTLRCAGAVGQTRHRCGAFSMSVSSQPFRLVLSLRGTPFSEGSTAERDRRLEVHSPLLLADGSKPKTNLLYFFAGTHRILFYLVTTTLIPLRCSDQMRAHVPCTNRNPNATFFHIWREPGTGTGNKSHLFLDIPIDCIPADKPIHHF